MYDPFIFIPQTRPIIEQTALTQMYINHQMQKLVLTRKLTLHLQ